MRTHMAAFLSMSLLAAGHAGCMVENPTIGVGEYEEGGVTVAGDQVCPAAGCGQNTPYCHGLRIDELHEDGASSEQGFRILGFTAEDGSEGRITIQDGEFRATLDDGRPLKFEGVRGGRIHVEWQVPSEDSRRYDLIIAEVAQKASWVSRDDRKVPVYTIIAEDLLSTTEDKPVCSTPDLRTTHAVLLADERYDVDNAAVRTDVPPDLWFTIACEGSALYKMRFAGYNPELPASDAFHTTLEQRQATLSMITADYCGIDGPSFTVAGKDLRWQNQAGWCSDAVSCSYFPSPPQSHEAIWAPRGALCLDEPRHVDRTLVEETCHIPRCGQATMASLGGEWETFVPHLAP